MEIKTKKAKKRYPKLVAGLWLVAAIAGFAACTAGGGDDAPKEKAEVKQETQADDLGGIWVKTDKGTVSLEQYQSTNDTWKVIPYIEQSKLKESGKYRYVTLLDKPKENGQKVERSKEIIIK